jgi:hypothetical protein
MREVYVKEQWIQKGTLAESVRWGILKWFKKYAKILLTAVGIKL